MAFNPNEFNKDFDKLFGAGAYSSGLQQARNAGRLKTQADFAKKAFLDELDRRREAAKHKTYDDALNYWNDPVNKNSLKKDGAYRRANDILNDPRRQKELEDAGYNVNDYIDAMYNAASEGKFRSQREYNQYSDELSRQTAAEKKSRDKEYKDKYGMSYQEYSDFQKAKKASEAKRKKEEENSVWGKTKAWFTGKDTDGDGKGDGILDALEIIDRPGDAVRTGIKEKMEGRSFWEGAKDGFTGKKNTSGTELNKKFGFDPLNNKKQRELSKDIGFGLLNTSGVGRVISSLAKPEVKDFVGRELAGGATEMVLDPLNLLGTGVASKTLGGVRKGLSAVRNLDRAEELLSLPAPQLRLNAPQMQLPGPRPIEPTLGTLNRAGTMPSGLQNPIPSMPGQVRQAVAQKGFQDAGLGFAQQGRNVPQARGIVPTLNASRGERELLGQNADSLLNNVNKVQSSPAGYYERRLLEVQNEMKAFNENRGIYRQPLNPDELYQRVRKPDDPETLDELVRLNQLEVANNKTNPIQGPREGTLNDALDSDPMIRELAQGLNFKAPEQNISRPATLDEMVNNLKEMTPLKEAPKPVEPLQFRREKGFNPDLVPKIKNRDSNISSPNPEQKKPNLGDVFKSLEEQKKWILKTVKTDKNISAMSKDELQGVLTKLEKKKELLAKGGKKNEKKVKQVEEDIKKVNDSLLKFDMQFFGEQAKKTGKPKAGAEKVTPAKDPKKEYAIAQSKQKKLVEDYKKKGKQEEEGIAKMLANSDKWKNKGRFAMGRETMTRNFEDIMGKDAEVFKKKFLDPIKSKEADRIRFLNKEREQVKSYGIKAKSKEDELVQMYGEKKITLNDLKQKTKDWKKVVKVAESYRRKYDELLDVVNKELTANGFNPIPKRADYFPHYEEVDGLMKKFGFDMENHSLPTDINGLTDQFKPNKNFFGNALRRKSDETTFGAVQGFDRYIEGVSNLIYHTKNIKQIRSLEKVIRTKYEGDTHLSDFAAQLGEYGNLLAGKKAKVDRVIEDTFGRKVYNAVETIRRKTGANMIGANIGSALTNFIPLTQSLATTNKKAFVKGLTETLSNVVKKDGFIDESDFLTKRIGSDPLYRTKWDSTIDKSMWLMRTLDNFTSQVITRGKYNELITKKIPHEEAIKQADEWAAKTIADRSKGGMPTLFNSKTFGVVSQFQLEVNNQVSHLFKDIPRNAKSKAALASAMGQVLLYSYLYNELYEKAIGRRPAFDPIGIAFQATKDYNNDNLTKGEATSNLVKNVAGTLPFTSLFTGGRIPVSAGVPNPFDAMEGKSKWTDELSKPLWYVLPPAGGGQIKRTLEGLTAMDKNPLSPQGTTGVYKNGKLQFPVEDNLANNIRGPVFGKYSFPETKDFYDNKRKTLSEKQTFMVEQNPEVYKNILAKQQINSIKKKIQEIQKDDSLSEGEKMRKLAPLFKQLQGG